MDHIVLRVQQLTEDAVLPSYAHPGDAGLDLVASEETMLSPGERGSVSTGLAVAVPDGYVGLVHPRSGLALNQGLTLVNAPGTIDSGYRGELKVLLVNLGQEPVRINKGDRIAQLVVQAVARAEVVAVDDLPATVRGTAGFGSTGVGPQA